MQNSITLNPVGAAGKNLGMIFIGEVTRSTIMVAMAVREDDHLYLGWIKAHLAHTDVDRMLCIVSTVHRIDQDDAVRWSAVRSSINSLWLSTDSRSMR